MEFIIIIIVAIVLYNIFSSKDKPRSTSTNKESLVISPTKKNAIKNTKNKHHTQTNKTLTNFSSKQLQNCINQGNDIYITYKDEKGDVTERTITPEEIYWGNSERRNANGDKIRTCDIEAFCHLRQDDRTFILERMLKVEIIK